MTTVSIVIATHNEGDNLARTIESIQRNTQLPNFEIILVDDGSTDDSLPLMESDMDAADSRIKHFRFQNSVGLIRARHQGVRLARGDYVVFLDAHMAVMPGWLSTLVKAIQRWGHCSVVTPDLSALNETTWSAEASSGQIITIDQSLDMRWQYPVYPTGLVPIIPGCCIIPRTLYYQVGGFDLGLRRWGCENIDLPLKIYAAGGACYLEPRVLIGHLFRSKFPYQMHYRDLNYNKLRTAYIHFSGEIFRQLLDRLSGEPAFAESLKEFQSDLSEIDHLRRAQQAVNRRDPDWFARTFWR